MVSVYVEAADSTNKIRTGICMKFVYMPLFADNNIILRRKTQICRIKFHVRRRRWLFFFIYTNIECILLGMVVLRDRTKRENKHIFQQFNGLQHIVYLSELFLGFHFFFHSDRHTCVLLFLLAMFCLSWIHIYLWHFFCLFSFILFALNEDNFFLLLNDIQFC